MMKPSEMKAQIESLEKRLKNSRKRLKAEREETANLRARIEELEDWQAAAARQINELRCDLDRANYNLIHPENLGPSSGPLESTLGVLVDQGGAIPVDGNAANIFKPPKL
jgi:small-conductance mechanosensitive channel